MGGHRASVAMVSWTGSAGGESASNRGWWDVEKAFVFIMFGTRLGPRDVVSSQASLYDGWWWAAVVHRCAQVALLTAGGRRERPHRGCVWRPMGEADDTYVRMWGAAGRCAAAMRAVWQPNEFYRSSAAHSALLVTCAQRDASR